MPAKKLKNLTTVYSKAVKRIIHIAIFLAVSLIATQCSQALTFASSGLVSQIGGATFVQGATHFWVGSTKPTFAGITSAGATVSGTVGSESVSATADSSGNWSWTPTADLSGDNAVSITSGSSTATFTLTIGSLPASVASSSASSLAPAGTATPTIITLGLGLGLFVIGLLGIRLVSKEV